MIRLLKYMKRREWLFVFGSVLFVLAQVFLELSIPDYMAKITQMVESNTGDLDDIIGAGGIMLLCSLGSLLSSFVVAAFAARIAADFCKELRALQFYNIQNFSMAEMRDFSTASLITRSTNDITQMQMMIAMGLQVAVKAPIMAAWAVTKIAGKGWEWTAATAGAVLLLVALSGVLVVFAVPKFRRIQGLTDQLSRVTRESLLGLRVVRAYNAERMQSEKFETANQNLTQNNLSAQRAMALMYPGMGFIMNVLSLVIYWIGAYLIQAAGTEHKMIIFSEMVVFINYAVQVVMSFMMLSMIFVMLPRAAVAAKRVTEVIETKPSLQDGQQSEGVPRKRGEVEFRHVTFRYPGADEDVLHDVSFTVHPGETVAFIGATGSGKSTLLNLLPRFYDVSEGAVLVDGVDVRDYTQKALHKKFGYVSQKAVLFSGSIFSNLAYGDAGEHCSLEKVSRALGIAQADFVEELPDGVQHTLARGGTNLSGGQRQRLAIARAICREPEIYLFDDSFSALDYRTDRALRKALDRETAGATTLIVAQRIGTIRKADRIIVLEEGKLVGMGRHEELMKTCAVYEEIALSQLSKEELAQ